jgi:hypothetical protein
MADTPRFEQATFIRTNSPESNVQGTLKYPSFFLVQMGLFNSLEVLRELVEDVLYIV